MARLRSFFLLLTALTLFAPAAWAGETLMVIPFSGLKKQEVTRHASAALEAAGHTLDKDAQAPNPGDAASIKSTAKLRGIRAFVAGNVTMMGKRWVLQVKVYSGADGTLLREFPLDSSWYPGLLKEVDKNLTVNVEAGLAGLAPAEEPAAAATAPAAAADDDENEADEDEAPADEDAVEEGPGPSPLFVSLQFGAVIRNWTPKDAIFKQLLGQENAGMLAPRIALGLYPGAFFTSGALANLGLVGSFEQSISGQTQVPATGPQSASTKNMSEQDYHFGLHFRIPAGKHQFGFSAGPGQHKLDTQISPGLFIPDVTYSYFRFGIDSQLNLGDIGLGLAAGYRPVSSLGSGSGQVASADWFPNAEADGMDLALDVGYNLSEQLAVVVSGDYRRYGLNFHRVPADQTQTQPSTGGAIPVAGGATDSYLGFWAGVTYHLPH